MSSQACSTATFVVFPQVPVLYGKKIAVKCTLGSFSPVLLLAVCSCLNSTRQMLCVLIGVGICVSVWDFCLRFILLSSHLKKKNSFFSGSQAMLLRVM